MLFYYLTPCKMTHHDIMMHAVHFWGQERGLFFRRECPELWLKKKGDEGGKEASALWWNMDMQPFVHFDLIQTEGAAYSTLIDLKIIAEKLMMVF